MATPPRRSTGSPTILLTGRIEEHVGARRRECGSGAVVLWAYGGAVPPPDWDIDVSAVSISWNNIPCWVDVVSAGGGGKEAWRLDTRSGPRACHRK